MMLQILDQHWREHLAALDHLRQGIHLRGYAQKQPKQEYKREAFELFGSLLDRVRDDVVRVLMTVRIQSQEEVAAGRATDRAEAERRAEIARAQHADFEPAAAEEPTDVEALTLPDAPRDAPRRSRSSASATRSAATIRALADRARSTSSATASSA